MSEAYTRVNKTLWHCNICHARFSAEKNAIQAHERSQKHTKAADKNTKYLMKQNKNKPLTEEEKVQREREAMDERNKARYSGNYDALKAKKKTPGGAEAYSSGYGEEVPEGPGAPGGVGKPPFHKGKDKGKHSEVTVKASFDSEFTMQGLGKDIFTEVWKLYKDEKGKLYFYNTISKNKFYERPIGVRLLPYEEKIWEDHQNKPATVTPEEQKKAELNEPVALVGQWEAVDDKEDYYKTNAVVESDESENEEIKDELKFEQRIEEFADQEGTIDDILDIQTVDYGKTALKTKTDKLKNLVESNLEMVSKPVFNKKAAPLISEEPNPYADIPGSTAFKKRNTNKQQKAILDFIDDETLQ